MSTRLPTGTPRPTRVTARLVATAAGLAALPLLALGTVGSGPAAAASAPAVVDRVMTDARIIESSGLARSGYSSTVLWAHNDSGGGPVLYAIAGNGTTVATYTLTGASAKDWEGMAAARSGVTRYLYVGDIGDNGKKRPTIAVHRVIEPSTLKNGTLTPTSWVFRYPDGPHNAETLLVNPTTLRIYIVPTDAKAKKKVEQKPKK